MPTGSSDLLIKGAWLNQGVPCDPSQNQAPGRCQFVANAQDNDQVTCSLGYLPFLPNVSRYCTLNEQWGVNQSLPPTKHNVLCKARGAHEVITSHDDFLNRLSIANPGNVSLTVVKEPTTKYVLVLESSSSMIKQDLWKWISKAAQKFIRNDLMTNTKMAIGNSNC